MMVYHQMAMYISGECTALRFPDRFLNAQSSFIPSEPEHVDDEDFMVLKATGYRLLSLPSLGYP